jgi:hypothetical protein
MNGGKVVLVGVLAALVALTMSAPAFSQGCPSCPDRGVGAYVSPEIMDKAHDYYTRNSGQRDAASAVRDSGAKDRQKTKKSDN